MMKNMNMRYGYVAAAIVVAALSACNGTAGPSVPSQIAPNAVGRPVSLGGIEPGDTLAPIVKLAPVVLSAGEVVGTDDLFTPKNGDGRRGGRGQAVDGIPCSPTEYVSQYHIHAYIGIVVDGRQVALPDAIGLKDPGPASSGFISTAKCFYYIHTHDASGTVHVEVPEALSPSTALYTVGNLLDIWGVHETAGGFGPFSGTVQVFVGNVPLKQTLVKKYALVKRSLDSIKLRSHEVVWIVVGKHPIHASRLPSVTFYTEY